MVVVLLICSFLINIQSMIKAASEGEQIQYITYKDLTEPLLEQITLKSLTEGFESSEWRKNFQTLTRLRQANKYCGSVLLVELLPFLYQQIIAQIDNLRSNNSKEALTLVFEIIDNQNIQKIDKNVICPIVSALFNKTTSEKAFLRKQALSAVESLPKKYNPYLLLQIANQIMSLNSQISELGAKILYEYVENNKITEINGEFLSLLIRTINGKRAVLQKKGKQILLSLRGRLGEQKIVELVEIALKQGSIAEQEHRALLQELKKQEKIVKSQPSLKDYLKMKKKTQSTFN